MSEQVKPAFEVGQTWFCSLHKCEHAVVECWDNKWARFDDETAAEHGSSTLTFVRGPSPESAPGVGRACANGHAGQWRRPSGPWACTEPFCTQDAIARCGSTCTKGLCAAHGGDAALGTPPAPIETKREPVKPARIVEYNGQRVFEECSECDTKPGSPMLCANCRRVRDGHYRECGPGIASKLLSPAKPAPWVSPFLEEDLMCADAQTGWRR